MACGQKSIEGGIRNSQERVAQDHFFGLGDLRGTSQYGLLQCGHTRGGLACFRRGSHS